ncbi:hypothetical protein MKW98_022224 [Papaver atlanticum]|uniref:25S rRNA (uridine-N(3))-methyltransferase BMT5-like domain-containing protein n=1 Tax=Papaver atlanticum TaxID=357466 RepID=A0AAD4T3W7_9MAGN|nr:hypothetical protein MKW98_022224 [Papaver atlanticum]
MGNFFSNTSERACSSTLSSANEWYEKPTPVPIRESTSSNISTREIRENHRTQEVVVKKREDHDVELKSTSDLQKEKKKSSEGTITHYNRSSIPFSIQNGSTADVEELLAIPEKEDEEQKKRKSSTSSTTSMRWITHYNSSQKILLVGEGDFSFASCLAHAFGSASNMVATSLDSKVTLDRRLPSSKLHIFDLRRLGCLVLHEIDVHFMASANSKVVSMKFDRIIYNFPHAGHWRKLREEDFELIRRHKELLSGFFKNSRKLLREDGEVHVTHRDDYPYNTWGIEKLAKKAGLFLIEKVKFRPEDYPSYSNKRGSRIRSWDSFGFGDFPMTFKFSPVKK